MPSSCAICICGRPVALFSSTRARVSSRAWCVPFFCMVRRVSRSARVKLMVFLVVCISPHATTRGNYVNGVLVKIGETGQPMFGLVNITLSVTPRNTETYIQFWQQNPFTRESTKLPGANTWLDFFFIKSTNNHLQERTNILLMWLTCVTAVFALIQIIPILMHIYTYLHPPIGNI